MKNPLKLTLACTDADQTRDFTRGPVEAEGIEITYLALDIPEMFHRFYVNREFDVSEASFGRYITLRSQGDTSFTALPVFASRIFRHSAIFVRRDGPVRRPEDLRGRRVGIPSVSQTAVIYIRGLLVHEYGVPLDAVQWVEDDVSALDPQLLAGEIDALACADPPASFHQPGSGVVRLIDDYRAVEVASFRKTGVFPIMHVIAMRSEILDAHPWAARSLYKAFEEAKRGSLTRFANASVACFPLPWVPALLDDARNALGPDWWPYGLEPNRTTLEAFLGFAFEQGVLARRLTPEELFPASLL